MIGTSFSFGAIQVNTQTNTLTISGKVVECEPKLFELLIFFCRNSERALSRDELIEHVWQGRVVSDAAVNRAISQLRKLIEPNPSQPIYILTVSKIGYRFAATPIASENKSPVISKTTQSKSNLNSFFGVVAALLVFAIFVLLKPKPVSQTLELTDRTILTEQLGVTFNPYFDEASKTLYALHKKSNDGLSQVVIVQKDGSLSPLFESSAYYTDVIARGDTIYLARLMDLTERKCEVVEFKIKTKKITTIVDCANSVISHLALGENDRLIYPYRESDSSPYKLMVLNTQTKRQQQLTHPESVGNTLGHRVFALNNNTLAYINYHATEPDRLVLLDIDNRSESYNAPLLDDVISVTWHNQTLLISAKSGLYQFDVTNQTLSQLDYSDTFNRIFASNNALYAEHYSVISNLYQLTDVQAPLALTQRQATIMQFTASPIDERIAYVESLNGKLSIRISSANSSEILPFDEQITYVSNLAWAFDASKLAANINDELYIYDFNNAKWQHIKHHFSAIHFVGFDDNSNLYVSAEHQQAWNIWQISDSSNTALQITFNGGYSFYFDKNTLYYTKFSQDGLFKTLDSKTEEVVIEEFPLLQWRNWQLVNNKIIYPKYKQYVAFDTRDKTISPIVELANYSANVCRMSIINEQLYCSLLDNQVSQIWRINISSSTH
ncbi:winged helix-turn-helix domain-containing protein [Pseudoalteromonas sp. SSM20]|uniref:winged helix-turn-helix domain-containing protein n=1 Tax=Pseudoalteromonas sp. SSM20 TaxID=3139394 RepID=UPI003BA93E53